MTRFLMAAVAASAVLIATTADAQAFGCKKRGGSCGASASSSGCSTGCSTAAYHQQGGCTTGNCPTAYYPQQQFYPQQFAQFPQYGTVLTPGTVIADIVTLSSMIVPAPSSSPVIKESTPPSTHMMKSISFSTLIT